MRGSTSCLTLISAFCCIGVRCFPPAPGQSRPLLTCPGLRRPHGRRRSRHPHPAPSLRPSGPAAPSRRRLEPTPAQGSPPVSSLSPLGRRGAIPLPPPGGGAGPRAGGGSSRGRSQPGPGSAAAPSREGRAGALPPRRAAFRERLLGGRGLCSAAGSLRAQQRPLGAPLPFPPFPFPPLGKGAPCPPAAAGPAAPHAPRQPPARARSPQRFPPSARAAPARRCPHSRQGARPGQERDPHIADHRCLSPLPHVCGFTCLGSNLPSSPL
ncbi:PREDICTED: translation initiation factor IF-2-like [Pseudopodoces humilis]|uniref:translation initiation factor IF-2-like n=1 Tax=Pseudopodoces humilis TaxID=181119 RepID=UPI0006B7BDAF|nr:PREDICTED: translation initiation factor IF-2-like [Pseudopodoces humilis]